LLHNRLSPSEGT